MKTSAESSFVDLDELKEISEEPLNKVVMPEIRKLVQTETHTSAVSQAISQVEIQEQDRFNKNYTPSEAQAKAFFNCKFNH